MKIAEEIMKNN